MQSNIKTMVTCLTVTCTICAAILGLVHKVTLEPIAETNKKILNESIGKVLPEGEISGPFDVEVGGIPSQYYTSSKDGQILAYAVRSQTSGFSGAIILMVGVMKDGTIYDVSVLAQSETPGLGAKCVGDHKFVSQWKGLNPAEKKLAVKKDGGDIDAITASTITSRAFTLAVKNAVEAVNTIKK